VCNYDCSHCTLLRHFTTTRSKPLLPTVAVMQWWNYNLILAWLLSEYYFSTTWSLVIFYLITTYFCMTPFQVWLQRSPHSHCGACIPGDLILIQGTKHNRSPIPPGLLCPAMCTTWKPLHIYSFILNMRMTIRDIQVLSQPGPLPVNSASAVRTQAQFNSAASVGNVQTRILDH
jgi:hypothetical protein